MPAQQDPAAGRAKTPAANLDFGILLQQVQKDQRSPEPERSEPEAEAAENAAAPTSRGSQEKRADDQAGEEEELAGGERVEERFVPLVSAAGTEGEAGVPMAAVEEVVEGTVLVEDSAPGQTAWTEPVPEIRSTQVADEGGEADVELFAGADLEQATAREGAGQKSQTGFDLLDFSEMMDPDLVVEKAPGQLLERLQQVVGAGSAPVLDEVAETVLPQVIRGLATLVRNGTAEMRLQLQPPDLGEIELRVRTTEAVVRGQVMVQHPEIKQLLDSQMERLRAALAEQGLELEGFDVSVGRDSRFAQADESWPGPSRSPGTFPPAGSRDESIAVESGPVRVSPGDHEVDYLI